MRHVRRLNTDARKIITRGEPANFFVYYLVDDDTSKHNLTLDGYGADDRWVLLEPIACGCTRLAVGMGFLGWVWGLVWFLKSVRQIA